MAWLVDPEDGRLELEPLVRIEDCLDEAGNVRLELLPHDWHVIEAHEGDGQWRAAEWSICRDDRWWWLTHWAWTFDAQDPIQPIKRFPEDEYLWRLTRWHERRINDPRAEQANILAEKTRAARFSLWMAAMALHGVMFRDHYRGAMLSHLYRRADDGGKASTPNSLMGKARQMYLGLPDWQRQQAPLEFTRGTIRNEATGGTIVAEVADEGAGRGPQFHEVYIDEAGYVPSLTLLFAGFKSSCPSGITAGGTPNGEGTGFHLACEDGREGKSNFRLFEIDWWQIPDRRRCVNCGSIEVKDPTEEDPAGLVHALEDCKAEDGLHWDEVHERMSSPWFREMARDLAPAMVRQELERSHSKARPGRIWSSFSRDQHVDVRHDFAPEGDHVVAWDFGIDNQTSLGWGWRSGHFLTVYDDYENNEEYPPHYCNYVAWVRGEFHAWTLNGKPVAIDPYKAAPREATIGACWLPRRDEKKFTEAWGEPGRWRGVTLTHCGDPSGAKRESSPGSWFLNLAKGAEWIIDGAPRRVGQIYMVKAYPDGLQKISRDEGIQAVDFMLSRRRIGFNPRCKFSIQALLNYHQHTNKQGAIVAGRGPAHDVFSHSADRLRYQVTFLFGNIGVPFAAAR